MFSKGQRAVYLMSGLFILVMANMLAGRFFFKIDMTEDKRYTLSPSTIALIEELPDVVFVRVLLTGKFPAGFKRLQTAVREMLQEFQSINSNVKFEFEDPLEGSTEEINERMKSYAQAGMSPTQLNVKTNAETSQQRIFPFAIFHFGERQVAVSVLESSTPGMSPEQSLNNSISLLEYKFGNAIQKLFATRKPNILFTRGQGELSHFQTADLERSIRAFYQTGRVNLDSLYQIPREIDLVIVAKPLSPFSEKEKFVLDQYVMNGGKIIFLIDRLRVNLDSIQVRGQYMPHDISLQLDDLLFNYGVRILPNLVMDLECSRIPMVVGKVGDRNQYELFPWYYHLIASPNPDHPIGRNLDRINLFFPASIDTIRTETPVVKTPLLMSSNYTRLQFSPTILDFEILKVEPDPQKFNKPSQAMAWLLEGVFPSLYKHRVSSEMLETLEAIDATFQPQSVPTSLLVISDGDLAANRSAASGNQIRELGYNPYEQYTYDNKAFLVNCIEYMTDQHGLMQARNKEVKLRLLDQPRIKAERLKWQLINVIGPMLFLIGVGILLHYRRSLKFNR